MVLGDVKNVFAVTYKGNAVVFSPTFQEHLEHLRITLERMGDADLTVNPDKGQLAWSRVSLLGHVVDHGTVRPSEHKLKSISVYPPLYMEKSLRRFVQILVSCHQFVNNYAQLSRPLNQLLRRGVR